MKRAAAELAVILFVVVGAGATVTAVVLGVLALVGTLEALIAALVAVYLASLAMVYVTEFR